MRNEEDDSQPSQTAPTPSVIFGHGGPEATRKSSGCAVPAPCRTSQVCSHSVLVPGCSHVGKGSLCGTARAWLASHPGLHPSPWMPSGVRCMVPGYPAPCPEPTGTSSPVCSSDICKMPALESQTPSSEDRSSCSPPSRVIPADSSAEKSGAKAAQLLPSCASRAGKGHTRVCTQPAFPSAHAGARQDQPLTRGDVWVLPLTGAAGCGKRSRRCMKGVSKQQVTALGGTAGSWPRRAPGTPRELGIP